MPKKLKPVVDSLDEVPEALHDLYEQQGEVFVLALDDIDAHPGVSKLASAFRKEKEQRRDQTRMVEQLKAQLGELGDMDPAQVKEALAKLQQIEDKQLLDSGKVEELFTQRTERMRKDFERQLAGLQQQIQEKEQALGKTGARLSEVLVDHAISAAATRAGVRPTALTDVLHRGRSIYKLVDDKVMPLDEHGEVVTGKNPALPMEVDEWLAGLQSDAPHLFEASTGAGAPGAKPNGQTGYRKTLAVSDSKGIGQNLEAIARGEFRFTDQ